MNIYYVYMYLREDGIPYYVGKGKGTRAYDKHSNVTVPKDLRHIIFVDNNLSESTAYELERSYIDRYGRVCNKSGILLNISPGRRGGIAKNSRAYTAYYQINRELANLHLLTTAEDIDIKLTLLLSLYKSTMQLNDIRNLKGRLNNAIFDLTKRLHAIINPNPKPPRKYIAPYKKKK